MKKKLFTRILTICLATVLFLGDSGIANAAEAGENSGTSISPVVRPEPEEEDPILEPWGTKYSGVYATHHEMLRTSLAHYQGYTGRGAKVAILGYGIPKYANESLLPEITAYDVGMGTVETGFQSGRTTYLGSIIAGTGNLSNGSESQERICGIAPQAQLMSIKVSDGTVGVQGVDNHYLAAGINKAVEEKANIICIGVYSNTYSPEVEDAILRAYQSGVAVFCMAGDSNTNALPMTCTYKGAIPVTALTEAMTLMPGANYGSKIRYSAVGNVTAMWDSQPFHMATFQASNDSACATAVTVGAAAVLWSQAKGSGKNKVDNLLKMMDTGCTKPQGSGMGKGMVNLARALKISDYDQAPAKPVFANETFVITDDWDVRLKFEPVPEDVEIYYALNNEPFDIFKYQGTRWNENYNNYISGYEKKTVVVRAVAYNKRNHLKSAETRATFRFEGEATSFSIEPTNKNVYFEQSFTPGESFGIKVTQYPTHAKKRAYSWTVYDANHKVTDCITVSSSNVVKISKDAAPGDYQIQASFGRRIDIHVEKPDNNPVTQITSDAKTLYLDKNVETIVPVTVKKKDGSYGTTSDVSWLTTESYHDVKVRIVDDTHIGITLLGEENSFLRVEGKERQVFGLGKNGSKAKLVINVIDVKDTQKSGRVSEILVSIANIPPYIGRTEETYGCIPGGSIRLEAEVEPVNAKNKKVEWKISPENQGVTVVNGTVRASTKATIGTYQVWACSLDGSGVESEPVAVQVIPKEEQIAKIKLERTNVVISNGYEGNM